MKTVDIKRFAPFIIPQAENCPEFVMRQAVAATVADICQKTGCLTTETCFKTQPGHSIYDLRFAPGIRSESVRHVYCDGVAVGSIRLDELARRSGRGDWRLTTGDPQFYTFTKPGELSLVPAPVDERYVRVMVTASVDRDTQQIPEQFLSDYLDTVVCGALSRIFRIAGQTYTNVRMADEYEIKYNAGLAEIRQDVARDFTRATGRVFYNRIV